MITVICALVILFGEYFIYGRLAERVFKPDDRPTPASEHTKMQLSNLHPNGTPMFSLMFVTVACGAAGGLQEAPASIGQSAYVRYLRDAARHGGRRAGHNRSGGMSDIYGRYCIQKREAYRGADWFGIDQSRLIKRLAAVCSVMFAEKAAKARREA